MKKVLSFVFFLLSLILDAQAPLSRTERIDSLCNSLARVGVNIFQDMPYYNFWNDQPDTEQDMLDVVACYESKKDTGLTFNDKLVIANFQAIYYRLNGKFGEAITVADSYLQEVKRNGKEYDLAGAYRLLARLYMDANMFEEALFYSRMEYEVTLRTGSEYEKSVVSSWYSWNSYVVGSSTQDTARLDTAARIQKNLLPYLLNAKTREPDRIYEAYKTYLMTLMRLKRYNVVIPIAKQGIEFANSDTATKETSRDHAEHGTWANHYKIHFMSYLASAYTALGNEDSAFYYLNQPEYISPERLPNTCYSTELNAQIGFTHVVGRVRAYEKFGYIDKACQLLNDALDPETGFTSLDECMSTRALAAPIYERAKMYKEAAECYRIILHYNDSINNEETRKRAISERVSAEITINLTKDAAAAKVAQMTAAAEEQTFRRNITIIASSIICFLLLIFLYTLNKRFKITKAQKAIIELKEKETHEQNVIITEQKAVVEEKQKEILDSIAYAKRIQQTLLAKDELLKSALNDYFVYYQPKDIVSGDFYWAARPETNVGGNSDSNRFYLAVCDSTGHGVPGAFMSVLNTSFLNQAISQEKLTEPNEILNYVRKELIEGVSQDGGMDGMDGILLCIDSDSNKIKFAGAHNSLILVRNGQLTEFRTDKMPVGAGHSMEDFRLQTLLVQKGDTIYLYTDGYADQFGGPIGKKFKYKKLNEIILANSSRPLNEQQHALRSAFENWKGQLEQIDDVCIVGFKI